MNKLFTILSILLGASGLVSAQTYADRQEVSLAVTAGTISEQKAITSLIARNEIQRGASAYYVAGGSVTLQPGFTAQAGAVFQATVEAVVGTRLVSEGDSKLMVKVYPNPFTDVVSVSYSLPEASTVKQTLTDEQGRLIRETGGTYVETSGTHQIQIRGNSMPTGIYFLQLQTKTDRQVVRLLKK